MTEKDEKPKDEAKDEPKPTQEETPAATTPPVADPAAQPAAHHGMPIHMPANISALEGLFTKDLIFIGVIVGIFLQFIGAVILNFDANSGAAIIFNLGAFVLSAVLICGALVNEKLDPYVRFGMFFVAGFIGFNLATY